MKREIGLSQKGILLVSIPLVFELIFVATLVVLQTQAETEATKALHAGRISDGTNKVVRDLFEIGSVTRGELLNTLNTSAYKNAVVKVRADFEELRDACKDDPVQKKIVQDATDAAEEAYDEVDKVRKIFESGETYQALDELNMSKRKLRSCLKRCLPPALIDMAQKEKGIQDVSHEAQAKFRTRIKAALAIGVILNIIVTVVVALFFSKKIVGRLKILLDNSIRLANDMPLNAQVGGNDEIGELDNSFHAMAEALIEAQKKEKALLANAVDVICSIDANGMFTAISPASTAVFGYPEAELTGRGIAKLIDPEDLSHTQFALQRVMSGGNEPPIENRVVRKDGKVIDVLWTAHWNPTEQSIFCVAHDISERKDAERVRQEVVQMVSHDLRTPLATIQTFHEMMATGMFGDLSERGKQLLKKADLNTGRMLGLINDLLDIEKINAGGFEIQSSLLEVNELLENATKSISDWALERGVILATLPTKLTAFADDKRVTQVLVNLLSNAVKFSPKQSTVTVSAEDVGGEKVMIKVADEGRGVPEHLREKIFDRFQQVTASDSRDKGGTGLGLAICKAIVELHGGTIKAEPNGSKGTIFLFTIPQKAPITNQDLKMALASPQSEEAST